MSRKPRSNIRSQSHRHEAGTASVGADGGLAEPGTDAGLESAVAGALGRDGQLDANGIVVTASQGSVSLSGTVLTEEERVRAEDCARSVPGVDMVENRIEVP